MKSITLLIFAILTLFSLTASAEVTVQTYNGYDHTYSDPNLREDADQDVQDTRDAVADDEFDGDARQDVENSYESHSAVHR
jgi:hypothetical protein